MLPQWSQVDPDTLRRLIQHMQRHGQPPDVGADQHRAEILAGSSVKLASEPSAAEQRGYQWKTVFLPEGTILRSSELWRA
jgi:hypothetical protein